MTLPADPLQWSIGLVGYGEVGRILAEDLRARGAAHVVAHDIKQGGPEEAPLRAHAQRHGVRLAASHGALAAQCDLLLSAVTASQAVPVAEACAPRLRSGAWFLDFNSASPGAKIRAGGIVAAAGGRYVEGAVMTSIPPCRIRVPLLAGGPHAAELVPLINSLGFAAQAGPAKLGVASATKMCRSVMIKGLEALVVESYAAARAYGVEEHVLPTLQETFPSIDWAAQGAYFFQRVAQHGQRRAEEMRESARTVREAGFEPLMTTAIADKQQWVAEQARAGVFHGVDQGARWQDWADALLRARAA